MIFLLLDCIVDFLACYSNLMYFIYEIYIFVSDLFGMIYFNSSLCFSFFHFIIRRNLLSPHPGKNIFRSKWVFASHFSTAGRAVEDSFGILVVQWRIYPWVIGVTPVKWMQWWNSMPEAPVPPRNENARTLRTCLDKSGPTKNGEVFPLRL